MKKVMVATALALVVSGASFANTVQDHGKKGEKKEEKREKKVEKKEEKKEEHKEKHEAQHKAKHVETPKKQ